MLTQLIDGAPGLTRSPVGRELATRLERRFRARGQKGPRALVVLLNPTTPEHRGPALALAARRVSEQALPVVVALHEDALPPGELDLPPTMAALNKWPVVHTQTDRFDELYEVLDALAEKTDAVSSQHFRTVRPSALPAPVGPQTLGNPTAMVPSFNRDPILMKIAASSGLTGLVLWSTMGFGPASLFLFLGTVTFAISKPSA